MLIVVPRDSLDETTVAIVTCTTQLPDEAAVRAAVRRAVNNWIQETPQGREAWEGSAEDFNVGDLTEWYDDPDLVRYLAQQDVRDLQIETYSCDAKHPWEYDDVLGGDDY